jgi:hypothetical protein
VFDFDATRLDFADRLVAAPLLRFTSIGVRWTSPASDWSRPVSIAEMDGLASVPRLQSLDTRGRSTLRADHVETLIRLPSNPLRQLAVLATGFGALNANSLQLLAKHCPSLRSLRVATGFLQD